MDVQVAGLHAAGDSTVKTGLATSADPPGMSRGLTGCRFDLCVVELMPSEPRVRSQPWCRCRSGGLAVAEGQPLRHPRCERQHAAHRVLVELAHQVEQAATFGEDRSAGGGELRHLGAQRAVRSKLRPVDLREAAGQNQAAGAFRQSLVDRRVKRHELGSGRREQLEVLLIVKGEGWAVRDRDACRHLRSLFGRPALAREFACGTRQRQDSVEVNLSGDRGAQRRKGLASTGHTLNDRCQAQMAFGC